MDTNSVDPEVLAAAFNGAEFPTTDPAEEGESFDAMRQFIEDAQLAGIVGWKATDGLKAETSRIDARAGQILKAERKTPASPAVAPTVTDDLHRLEKRYMAGIHSGKEATRIEKSANGWIFEYDENDDLIRGYVDDEDEAA